MKFSKSYKLDSYLSCTIFFLVIPEILNMYNSSEVHLQLSINILLPAKEILVSLI